jgi:lysine decarboxylase
VSLAGVRPVYAYPDIVDPYGISGPVSAKEIERCLAEHPDAAAVILPSPNYYGICSDIASIAEVVHNAGKVLIVDQAHGAHLKFFAGQSQAGAAEDLGADIVIASTHKTLASFTESAVANVMSDRIDLQRMEDALGKMESTSPSYVLMASLDVNVDLLEKHGRQLIQEWQNNIDQFYETARTAIPGLKFMSHPMLDRTKINLDMSAYGFNGHELERALNARGIWPELVTGNIVMCMTGIGNSRDDYERLMAALEDIATAAADAGNTVVADETAAQIAESAAGSNATPAAGESAGATAAQPSESGDESGNAAWSFPVLEQRPIPTERIESPLDDAAGMVCARALIPYPPGIPIVCPGEVLTEEICKYLKELRRRGENVIGVSTDGTVSVGR